MPSSPLGTRRPFESIERDLHSADVDTRGAAVRDLLVLAQTDPSSHPRALPIFKTAVASASDAWSVVCALNGIGVCEGPAAERQVGLELLKRPETDVVGRVVATLDDTRDLPVLIDLLERRPEPSIHAAAIVSMGRMKDPAAFPVIVSHLANPNLRMSVIAALDALGDPRAVPYLEPLTSDNAESGQYDERGYMWRVGDLAHQAIQRLRPTPRTAPPVPAVVGRETIPPLPVPPAIRALPVLPLPVGRSLLAFVPLIIAAIEIPWVIFIVIVQLYLTGGTQHTETRTHLMDVIALSPAMVGLAIGIVVILQKRSHRLGERVCLYIGCLLCAAFAFPFAWEFTH